METVCCKSIAKLQTCNNTSYKCIFLCSAAENVVADCQRRETTCMQRYLVAHLSEHFMDAFIIHIAVLSCSMSVYVRTFFKLKCSEWYYKAGLVDEVSE